MLRTATIVPKTYDELFRHYYPYVRGLVKKYKVHPNLQEDVAMTLLEKFIEKDMLGQFDPDYVGGDGRKIKFSAFLSGFVLAYVRHYSKRSWIEAEREMTLVNQTMSSGRADSEGDQELLWLDVRGHTHQDDLTGVEYDMLVHTIRLYLHKLPTTKKKNFLLLFDLVLDQLEEHGHVYKTELAELFDCSPAYMTSLMKQLGEHVRKAQC